MEQTDPVRRTPCEVCGASSIVIVNGYGSCLDHLDAVFHRAVRLLMILRDVPTEQREAMEVAMIASLVDAHRSGRWHAFAFDIDRTDSDD